MSLDAACNKRAKTFWMSCLCPMSPSALVGDETYASLNQLPKWEVDNTCVKVCAFPLLVGVGVSWYFLAVDEVCRVELRCRWTEDARGRQRNELHQIIGVTVSPRAGANQPQAESTLSELQHTAEVMGVVADVSSGCVCRNYNQRHTKAVHVARTPSVRQWRGWCYVVVPTAPVIPSNKDSRVLPIPTLGVAHGIHNGCNPRWPAACADVTVVGVLTSRVHPRYVSEFAGSNISQHRCRIKHHVRPFGTCAGQLALHCSGIAKRVHCVRGVPNRVSIGSVVPPCQATLLNQANQGASVITREQIAKHAFRVNHLRHRSWGRGTTREHPGAASRIVGDEQITCVRWRGCTRNQKLMCRKAWPLVCLKHAVSKTILLGEVEVRLHRTRAVIHVAVCRVCANYTTGFTTRPALVKAVNSAFVVLNHISISSVS